MLKSLFTLISIILSVFSGTNDGMSELPETDTPINEAGNTDIPCYDTSPVRNNPSIISTDDYSFFFLLED